MSKFIAPNCRFCLANRLLVDAPLYENESLFVLGSIEPHRPHAAILVPKRHVETPFELSPDEWSAMADAIAFAKEQLQESNPDGYTLGWNVGAAAGQDVFHAHMHVIARFKGEAAEGVGLHGLFRAPS